MRTLAIDGRTLLLAGGAVAFVVAAGVAFSRITAVRTRVAPFTGNLRSGPSRHPLLGLLAVTLTALYWGMQIGVMAGLLGIFGVATAPSLLLGLMGLPVLIGMLSPVPGGAGVRESLMAAVAGLAGVSTGSVILAAVAYRLALFAVTPIVWGAVRVVRAVLRRQRPAARAR